VAQPSSRKSTSQRAQGLAPRTPYPFWNDDPHRDRCASGNDSNAGALAQPLATLQKALDLVETGDTVWIRGGTYRIVEPVTSGAGILITKSGSSDTNCRLGRFHSAHTSGGAGAGVALALAALLRRRRGRRSHSDSCA
jgi:hypothetical protein